MSTAIDIREMGPDDVPFVAQLLESVGADASGLEAPRFVGELRLIAERAGELLAYACWLPDGRLGQMAAGRPDEWDIIAKQMVDKALYRVQRAGAGCCHLELPSSAADPFWRQVRWAKTQSPSCRRLAGTAPPVMAEERSSADSDPKVTSDSQKTDTVETAGQEASDTHTPGDAEITEHAEGPTEPTEAPVVASAAGVADRASADDGMSVEQPVVETSSLEAVAPVADGLAADIEGSVEAAADTETGPADCGSPEGTEQADSQGADDSESEHRPSRAA